MCDVYTFDRPERSIDFQDLLQSRKSSLGIDVEHFGLYVLVELAAQRESLKGRNLVADPCSPLELQRRGRFVHIRFKFLEQLLLLAFEKHPQTVNIATVLVLANSQIARSSALANIGKQARPKPPPFLVILGDVQRTGAKSKDLLQDGDRTAQALGRRERPIEFGAAIARCAGKFDSRKILTDEDFQIRKGLVILETFVERRLKILN